RVPRRGEGRSRGAAAAAGARLRADRGERPLIGLRRWLRPAPRVPAEVWPVRLRHGRLVCRPLEVGDARVWAEVRQRNAAWLGPWEATVPPGVPGPPPTFRALVGELRAQAAEGRCLPYALEV